VSISPEQFSDWDWNADPEDFVPARLCMEWTTTRPKVEGHYWVDNALCDEPELVYVTQGYYDLVVFRAEHWTETITGLDVALGSNASLGVRVAQRFYFNTPEK